MSRMDKRAWDKLYFGIRRDINLGIRHGLTGGSIVGTFIDEDGTGTNGGQIQKPSSSKFKKTRRRQPVCRPSQRSNRASPCRRRRQSKFGRRRKRKFWM